MLGGAGIVGGWVGVVCLVAWRKINSATRRRRRPVDPVLDLVAAGQSASIHPPSMEHNHEPHVPHITLDFSQTERPRERDRQRERQTLHTHFHFSPLFSTRVFPKFSPPTNRHVAAVPGFRPPVWCCRLAFVCCRERLATNLKPTVIWPRRQSPACSSSSSPQAPRYGWHRWLARRRLCA